ncbi:choice-of-anchor P family protein [Streptomyces sp. NPDC001795]|uniref:choice-of-anchor P family protein n=1 Tax=unclassified Streptomyces TaxID=2593676 RepID=UPI003318E2E2
MLAATAALGAGSPVIAQASDAGTTRISYRGHTFTVPADWKVVDLDKNPTACVRFDRHAVYLGTPGKQQDCPADATGRTEALLVQPAKAAKSSVTENRTDRTYRAAADGIAVTAPYADDRAEIRQILSSAGLPVASAQAEKPSAAPSALAVPADATSYQGKGFDACAAPSQGAMDAWKATSGYGAVGVYIGGENRGCDQANLNAQWVQTQYANGWRFLPIYVGKQATADSGSCSGSCTVITDPVPQGTAAAEDAVRQAAALGLGAGSVIYENMENYPRGGTNTSRVVAYLEAWTKRLHELGYRSGAYGGGASLVPDLVAAAGAGTVPDVIFTARWNDQETTDDPAIPATLWADHQRVHQYQGDLRETHGGVTIGIDRDIVDVGAGGTPQPPQPKATKLTYSGPATVSNGSAAKLSATLTTDTGEPVADKKVSFALGNQTCDGTTDAQGAANCTIDPVNQQLTADATAPVKVTFAGDDAYLASEATATVKLQYVTGRAYGLSADVSLLGLPVGVPPTPDTGAVRTAGAQTTAPPCTADVSAVVLHAKTLCATVVTKTGPSSASSTASVEEASIGLPGLPVLGLSAVKAVSTSSCTAVSGSTDLTLTVAGTQVKLDGTPNQTVDLGVLGTKLVVDEQVKNDGGLTVNAVHLTAPGVDVVIGSSTSAAHNCG